MKESRMILRRLAEAIAGQNWFIVLIEVFDSAKDRLGIGASFAEELSVLSALLVQRLGAEVNERP
jgi:hypothetical protein